MSRRRRWQPIAAGFALGVLAIGAGLHAGQPDAPPCSPGWHQAPASLAMTYGPCFDSWAHRRPECVPVRNVRPRPLPFTLASCVPDARRGHG